MRFFVFIIATMVMATGSLAATCSSPRKFLEMKAPDPVQKAWILSQVYSNVKYNFAHFASLPTSYDLDKEFITLLDEVSATKSRFVFDKALARFFAGLHNSHTRFYDNKVLCSKILPFSADFIENKWIITHADNPDIIVGSEILAIDGQEFSRWVEKILPYIADSSIRGQRHLLTSRAYGAWLWPEMFTLKLSLPSGRVYSAVINRNYIMKRSYTIEQQGRYEPPDGVTVKVKSKDLLYISISDFGDPAYEEAAIEAITHNRAYGSILLDLRETDGGTIPARLAMALARHPFPDMISLTPRHDALDALHHDSGGNAHIAGQNLVKTGEGMIEAHPIYQGKMFFLADNGCASACEGFLMLMKQAHRGGILGSPTWGMNGGSFPVTLGSADMVFRIGVETVLWADGAPFEGIGVLPDKSFPLTQDELVEGKDAVLQQAVSFINSQEKINH